MTEHCQKTAINFDARDVAVWWYKLRTEAASDYECVEK